MTNKELADKIESQLNIMALEYDLDSIAFTMTRMKDNGSISSMRTIFVGNHFASMGAMKIRFCLQRATQ